VITGASSGIGRALAYWYLNSGSKVALVSKSDLDELNRIAENFPGQALVCLVDLTIDMDVFELKQEVINKFGGVDILINCAGAIYSGDVESLFPQDYDYLMDLNLRSPFLLTLFFKKYLKHRKAASSTSAAPEATDPSQACLDTV
jgi:NAD(P)-dependent dehydrogenase (short-subunit alcohol dehydrogenase family)